MGHVGMFGKWKGSLRNSEGRICKKFQRKSVKFCWWRLVCWVVGASSQVFPVEQSNVFLWLPFPGGGVVIYLFGKLGFLFFFPGLENARCSACAWGHFCATLVGLFQRNSLITSYLHTYGILSWRQTHRFIFTYSPYRSTPHWFFCWSKKQ